MNKTIPRPPLADRPIPQTAPPPIARGFGQRSLWPLPAVGEAARRDPHIPDPVPGLPGSAQINADAFAGRDAESGDLLTRGGTSQRYASPQVPMVDGLHAGGGMAMTGQHPYLVYIKLLGTLVTRTLARNLIVGNQDARWRLGGVSYPPDFGYGPGYHGDAATLWPDNPQVYLRNPGIKPTVNVPQTYRYAPNMVQPLGPTIADFGMRPNFSRAATPASHGSVYTR